jgi:hypothetical protein
MRVEFPRIRIKLPNAIEFRITEGLLRVHAGELLPPVGSQPTEELLRSAARCRA